MVWYDVVWYGMMWYGMVWWYPGNCVQYPGDHFPARFQIAANLLNGHEDDEKNGRQYHQHHHYYHSGEMISPSSPLLPFLLRWQSSYSLRHPSGGGCQLMVFNKVGYVIFGGLVGKIGGVASKIGGVASHPCFLWVTTGFYPIWTEV